MKELKTLILTFGIGSAIAILLAKPPVNEPDKFRSKKLSDIKKRKQTWDDDNDMCYI